MMYFVDVWAKHEKGFSTIEGIFARVQDVSYGWIQ